jgi:hypothetical protein
LASQRGFSNSQLKNPLIKHPAGLLASFFPARGEKKLGRSERLRNCDFCPFEPEKRARDIRTGSEYDGSRPAGRALFPLFQECLKDFGGRHGVKPFPLFGLVGRSPGAFPRLEAAQPLILEMIAIPMCSGRSANARTCWAFDLESHPCSR